MGIALILVGQLPLDQTPTPSLPPITTPSPVAATESPSELASPSVGEVPPTPTPVPADWVATQLQIESVGINVAIQRLPAGQPIGDCCAYLLPETSEPGRGSNAYLAGHALLPLMKGLWNVQVGAEVRVLMSDGAVLVYWVTEVRPNISCPDPDAPPMDPPIPLALQYAPPGCGEAGRWTAPTDHEQLTMQTSQGFNRNWGELIVIALPASGSE